MNIDAHVHLVGEGWVHDDFFLNIARIVAAGAGKETGEVPDPASMLDWVKGSLFDTTGEKLVAEMDAAGVDRSCIFAVDYGLHTGEPGVPIEEQNKLVADTVKRFPDRLTGFFTVDPRRPQALDMFRRAVEDGGMKGLKLHPAPGWYAYEKTVYPLYEQCLEYKMPVLIHTGSQPGPLKSRFCRPVYVDDVAADFPELPIIMAHCGHSWWKEALMVCNIKPNCYVDFSGWQREFLENPLHLYRVLRQVIDTLGPWRVFFGTDGPYFNAICPLENWVNAFRQPQISSGEVSFTAEEMDIVMGRAFARLLSLG